MYLTSIRNNPFYLLPANQSSNSTSSTLKVKPIEKETLEKVYRIFKVAMLILIPTMLITPILLLYLQKQTNNFWSAPAFDPTAPLLHPAEEEMKKIYGKEVLEFSSTDPRPKLLFLMAADDYNGALKVVNKIDTPQADGNTKTYDHGIGRVLESIDQTHDIRFNVIDSAKKMCQEIANAAKVGNLKSLVINGHGSESSISFSDMPWKNLQVDEFGKLNVDNNCFDGLDPDATISLVSCETGISESSIASSISKLAQRVVWAPNDKATAPFTVFSPHVPTIPTFLHLDHHNRYLLNKDATCKYLPDGSRICGAFSTKIYPAIRDYVSSFFN